MELLEGSNFLEDKVLRVFAVCDCVLFAVEYLNWEFELVLMGFDEIYGFKNIFCHFDGHEGQHHSVIKNCMKIIRLFR